MKCSICKRNTDKLICKTCWAYALEKLEQFPQKYRELENALLPSRGRVAERVGGSKEPPLPVRLEVLHLRTGGISKPLMKHEQSVRIEQRHTRITFRGEEIHKITLTCTYLTAQSEWIYDNYKSADNLTKDINSIYKSINSVLGLNSHLITIGTCPADIEGETCGMKLQINPATLTSFGSITCKACGSVWEAKQWRLLGRVLEDAHD